MYYMCHMAPERLAGFASQWYKKTWTLLQRDVSWSTIRNEPVNLSMFDESQLMLFSDVVDFIPHHNSNWSLQLRIWSLRKQSKNERRLTASISFSIGKKEQLRDVDRCRPGISLEVNSKPPLNILRQCLNSSNDITTFALRGVNSSR
jgi:hypothetical protein